MDKRDDIADAYAKINKPEPGPDLDNAILRAAQDELRTAKANERKANERTAGFWDQWLKPLGAVAAMGFCLALVLQVVSNAPQVALEAPPAQEFAVARDEQREKREQTAPELSAPATVAAAPPSRLQFDRDAENLAMDELTMDELPEMNMGIIGEEEMAIASLGKAAPMADKAAAESELNEIVVAARQSTDSRSLAGSALSDTDLADDALTAWNAGARPAVDVWLAGIIALENTYPPEVIEPELRKLQRTYPGVDRDALTDGSQSYAEIKSMAEALAGEPATSTDDIAGEEFWAAAINSLRKIDAERAEAETEKLRQVYPSSQ